MTDSIQIAMDRLTPIFKVVDAALDDWSAKQTDDSCLQFPVLMAMIAAKVAWDAKQVRENDPFVRWYVRNHPNWHVTRGAHGGIMKAEDKQKKEDLRNAKISAKAEMKAALEAELAAKKLTVAPTESSSDDSELES